MTEDKKKEAHLEGKILKELSHPNIIHFREVINDKDYLYIVMDYADGGDLSMKIKEQNGKFFQENKILDWFTQICLAIKHIHDRKILHRDIKSQNIFLMKNGQIKLGDFGIAKCLNQTIDKAKTYVGTPYYLSPEIINSQPYDFKSDIWSLGVLLYEMCALKMPFDASNLPQLYIKIINCNYPPLNNNYSDELKKLVKAMLNETSLKRPNIGDILNYPIIKSRIKKFLNDEEYENEFSHSILHKFNLNSSDKKKKEYNSNKNLRISSGHNNNNERKMNYHYNQQQQQQNEQDKGFIDFLKKNLEGKAIQSNINKNKKYFNNVNNINNSAYSNNFMRNKKIIKNSTKEELYYNNNNDYNNINGFKYIENTPKYEPNSGTKQRKIEYMKKNSNNSNKIRIVNSQINNSNNYNNIKSSREKEIERKKNLEIAKKKGKQSKEQNNGKDVVWMKGMENYNENKNEIINNQNIDNFDNIKNITTNITENDKKLCDDLILGKNSANKEKNYIVNSNEFFNEEAIKANKNLFEDLMQQDNGNNIYYDELINNNEKISYSQLKENYNNQNIDIDINEELVCDNILNEISNEYGKELSENISHIIKKYVNDDILMYDYSKTTENIIKECKKNNISQNIIEKAIKQIPDFYCLILKKRL